MFVSDTSAQQLVELKIVRQPNSVYRMRYKTDTRQTNLFADDSNQSDDNQTESETVNINVAPSTSSSASTQTTSTTLLSKTKRLPPKVQIVNSTGPGTLRVTCVCPYPPYYVHPNFLYGLNCKNGIAEIPIEQGVNSIELKDIRIELVKKSDIRSRIDSLKVLKIDPFNAGYDIDYTEMDLGRLRLCFELFLTYNPNLYIYPIVSNVISTNKQKISILIQKRTNMKSLASGGDDVVLFVKKLEKDQKPILAKFFDNSGWCACVEIKDIHYRCAMIFKAPAYKDPFIDKDVNVHMKLCVPSDKDSQNNTSFLISGMLQDKYVSETLDFTYLPMVNDNQNQNKKRKPNEPVEDFNFNDFSLLDPSYHYGFNS